MFTDEIPISSMSQTNNECYINVDVLNEDLIFFIKKGSVIKNVQVLKE